MSAERRRLTLALLLSLLIHALLLSLTFGGQGLGLPGFALPWQERRIEAPDLHIVLVPASAAAPAGTTFRATLQQPSILPPVADAPVPSPSLLPLPPRGWTAEAIVPDAKPAGQAQPEPDAAVGAAAAQAPLRTEGFVDAAPTPMPDPTVIAMDRSDDAPLAVPANPPVPVPVIAAAPSASSPETVMPVPGIAADVPNERIDPQQHERVAETARPDRSEREAQGRAAQPETARMEIARQEVESQEAAQQAAARQEAAQQETARLEAERRETARQAAARQAAAQAATARQEAARQEAQRIEEIARQEVESQEAARQAAARQEAAQQETARLEAERREAARQAAARQAAAQEATARQEAARQEAQRIEETARLEAERQEAARAAAARQEAARVQAAQAQAARREETLRAIGRQLDEEAARREAASAAADLPSGPSPSPSSARRGRLFGRTDANAELILYAEAWARKIQLNMTFDMVRDAARRPHTDPLVTVAIRSDGSVESVSFVRSSGVAELDEAIRRVVQSQVPYPAFPPGLAREFDVIEIRRTWHFDMAIRLY